MAPVGHTQDGAEDWLEVANRLEELYQGNFLDGDEYDGVTSAKRTATIKAIIGSEEGSPSVAVPEIISYLSNHDAARDPDWAEKFKLVRTYLAETYKLIVTGSLGFEDPKLRAAIEDARVMVQVHRDMEKASTEKTPWTEELLHGQLTQGRLLTYPKAFPLPEPDRARSDYRPVKPTPRPDDRTESIWTTSFELAPHISGADSPSTRWGDNRLAEVDGYVESENRFFAAAAKAGRSDTGIDYSKWLNVRFDLENAEYEECIRYGPSWTCSNAPPPHYNTPTGPRGPDNPDGTKGSTFYVRRGWQRGALQHCLNMFTSHENRVINTPWRRAVLPYTSPLPLPKEVAYAPRVVDPVRLPDALKKDPFSWLQLMSQYTQTIDFLAECQRRRYNNQAWANFSASALPENFRGPRIYRGLSVYNQHWLQIGEGLEALEDRLHDAWAVAPRPLLRAILRDIDAGRQEDSGTFSVANGEDDDTVLAKKRYWRRDIKRRPGIDTEEERDDDRSYQLVDEKDIAWLRYLCEPSRTAAMCDPYKQPPNNLAILFDAKLQSYFRTLAESGAPDTSGLPVWHENREDIRMTLGAYRPNSVRKVVAYINGCEEKDVKDTGNRQPDPGHPNGSYQFALDEAHFLCQQLEGIGRCVYTPSRNGQPATVDRPKYTVHPEDRITWRYLDADQFDEEGQDYLREMLEHYHNSYASWATYKPDRPSFSRELEYMLDHVGPDFTPELERIETQDERTPDGGVSVDRLPFIRRYLVPEVMCRFGSLDMYSVELQRSAPCWDDIASWEAAGDYVADYQAQQKAREEADGVSVFYSYEPYRPQTPERTVQFLRNLAYRMGRTLRHVDHIKERLQYLDDASTSSVAPAPAPALDLSPELKMPRPEDQPSNETGNENSVVAVEKWWHAISAKDYDLAIKSWNTAIQDGTGEVALLPPCISEVLAKAVPSDLFRNKLKEQDPYTEIREGIISDCVRNLPTLYPVRLSGFKDSKDKEFQGYVRPNLFEWATKDQRRYQAPHTREHFFNMQRWPPCRIPPERLQDIRARKDEVLRQDPSQDDQAYGILTHRLPVGKEKPLYAQPIVTHHHHLDVDDLYGGVPGSYPPFRPQPNPEAPQVEYSSLFELLTSGGGNQNGNGNSNGNGNGNGNNGGVVTGVSGGGDGDGNTGGNNNNNNNNQPKENVNMVVQSPKMSRRPIKRPKTRARPVPNGGLVPFKHSNTQFAPGPAIFPMGDTMLQKMWVSQELTNALYPKVPLHKQKMLGLPALWHKIIDAKPPMIPLVPAVSRANLPRSNPNKRKMPIEFLNNDASSKKFRSDVAVGIQTDGSGGQFAAAVYDVLDTEPLPIPEPDPVPIPVPTGEYDPRSVRMAPAPGVSRAGMGTGSQQDPVSVEEDDDETITAPAPVTPVSALSSIFGTRRAPGSSSSRPISSVPQTAQQQQSSRPTSQYGPAPPIPNYDGGPPEDAYAEFQKSFPEGFKTLGKDIHTPYLVTSGLIALEQSINAQLAGAEAGAGATLKKKVDRQELANLLENGGIESECLRPFRDPRYNNFAPNALAYLLKMFGDRRGVKLQLGLIHNDSAGTLREGDGKEREKLAPFLLGSPYHNDTDKRVVWVRLTVDPSPFPTTLFNPYNQEPYNTYKGVTSR